MFCHCCDLIGGTHAHDGQPAVQWVGDPPKPKGQLWQETTTGRHRVEAPPGMVWMPAKTTYTNLIYHKLEKADEQKQG